MAGQGLMARCALVVAASMGLAACGALGQSEIFQDSFWASSPMKQNDEAELGIAQLAKGNFVTAEAHFQKALKANPRDVDALLGAGILYQNTGQLTKSREMYEAVLALRPDEGQQFVVWNNLSTRPASQIASVNLSLLDSGEVPAPSAWANRPPASPVPPPPFPQHPRAAACRRRPPVPSPPRRPWRRNRCSSRPWRRLRPKSCRSRPLKAATRTSSPASPP